MRRNGGVGSGQEVANYSGHAAVAEQTGLHVVCSLKVVAARQNDVQKKVAAY